MDFENSYMLLKAEERRLCKCLFVAASNGNHAEVLQLLKEGVSVNAVEYNRSLFYAAKNCITPLQIACQGNHVECVKTLIEFKADVNAKDRFDVTALHLVAEKGYYDCMRELLNAGADCNCPIDRTKKVGEAENPYLGGTTPLHLAAANNHVDCVRELIKCGADYNAVDQKGRTSLYIATCLGFEECALVQLHNAIGWDILSLPGYETEDTPLHFAVKLGMVKSVRELLKHGSDANHLNSLGQSPLHTVLDLNPETEAHVEEVLRLLVLEGYQVDVNKTDNYGFTPLHYVSFNHGSRFVRRPRLAQFLISYGADPNIKIQRRFTLIETELNLYNKDNVILQTIAQSEAKLPSLHSMTVSTYLGSWYQDTSDRGKPIRDNFIRKAHWYNEISSNPRALQHISRCCIRSSLGHKRIRHIKDLPIPLKLQQYLLLDGRI